MIVETSAPGRICLFGEHQDYLGLPVVAMAVDLRFHVTFKKTDRSDFLIHTPDLKDQGPVTLDIQSPVARNNQDYCWGIARTLIEEGFKFPHGGEVTFRSKIPVRAGCSSSSAMSAAWMRMLLEIGEHPEKKRYIEDPELAAYLVYRGEKELFQGAGGMMDQYSCYLGGLLHVFPDASRRIPFGVEKLNKNLEGIILIDSGEPKDTQGVLSYVGRRARAAIEKAADIFPSFDIRTIPLNKFKQLAATAPPEKIDAGSIDMVVDQLRNRDICQEGLGQLRGEMNHESFGKLLSEEHSILSLTLGISTPLIDSIQKETLDCGASGAKINGSGGGGTLFCYAPDATSKVTDCLKKSGRRHFVVKSAEGARVEKSK